MSAGQPTKVTGTIRVHEGLRPWTGLELTSQVCGQHELQLTFMEGDSSLRLRQTEALAGCAVEAKGRIDNSPTAHYSAEMFVEDAVIKPDASCHPAAVGADLSKIPIPSDLQSYRASIFLNFGDTSKPMRGTVGRPDGSAEKLTPWQSYIITGLSGSEDLLWVTCREGFQLTNPVATANGEPTAPDPSMKGQAGLSATDKPGPSSITITCVREQTKSARGISH